MRVGKALDPEFPPSDEVGSQQNYSARRRGAVAWTPCASQWLRGPGGGPAWQEGHGEQAKGAAPGPSQWRSSPGQKGQRGSGQGLHPAKRAPLAGPAPRYPLSPTPLPRGVKERAAAQGPRRSGLGLLPAPRELSCGHSAPRSAPPPPGGFLGCPGAQWTLELFLWQEEALPPNPHVSFHGQVTGPLYASVSWSIKRAQ